ncbi:unnamed protein product [Gordionus sp. m RMFG-2023]
MICLANITTNNYEAKNIRWFEKLFYVYFLGPLLFLGIIGNILYFTFNLKMKHNDISHGNSDQTHHNTNIVSKDSNKLHSHTSNIVSFRPSKKNRNASTTHFYVIIYAILLWDVIACVNLIFFPFLYYSSSDLGISNKIFMIFSIKVTLLMEHICAANVNWDTTILSMNRFMAIYFPHRFANLTSSHRPNNEGENEVATSKYSLKKYLNHLSQFFGHRFILKKTQKSALILMISICFASILISMPYLFYVDIKRGLNYVSAIQNTTAILYPVSCESFFKKSIKFNYYFKLSKFYHNFSPYYDKFFSILVYLLPTLLITISNVFIYIKLKKLKRTGVVKSPLDSKTASNYETSLTMANQITRPSVLDPNVMMGKLSSNIIPNNILPLTQKLRQQLLKNDPNFKEAKKSSKLYFEKYVLTLAIGIEFLLLNLPYVIYVFATNESWVENSSSNIIKIQTIVYFLKHSNHSINVYINIIYNSAMRSLIMFQLNKCYK